jgi:ATP-dependent DNA ligase
VVKYDGYRLRLERDGERVLLITRGGYDWTRRYPWIVEAARKIRRQVEILDQAEEPKHPAMSAE